jgi:hypothetical protein
MGRNYGGNKARKEAIKKLLKGQNIPYRFMEMREVEESTGNS